MKRCKKIFIMLMCALLIAVQVTTESESDAVAKNRTEKDKISGWVTVQNGQKKYYKKGQYLKGCKKIEKNFVFSDRIHKDLLIIFILLYNNLFYFGRNRRTI